MKKTVSLLLIFFMILSILPLSASAGTSSIAIDGYNTTRYSENLIIYTPDKSSTTGTNEWGYEAVVENNVITKVSATGNSTVPENGFVVSAHGEKADWLKANARVGYYADYENEMLSISDSAQNLGVFFSKTTSYSGINIARDSNTLVIYNKLGTRTGSNEWGFEVVVEGGVVSSIGGNNNTVPTATGSFVLSGHSSMADWLRENAELGMVASYDKTSKTVTLSYDENAIFSGMALRIKELRTKYNEAVSRYDVFDYKSASSAIDALEAEISTAKATFESSKNSAKLQSSYETFKSKCDTTALMLCESKVSEYRAVWIRPTQKNASSVDDYVQRLYECGINTICLETLIDSCMIMPMPSDSLFEHHPKFGGFDVLQAYINSCHKRNMELHVWMPVFYVGDSGSYYSSRSVGSKKPEWLSVSNTGKTTGVTDGFIMLDPANREAKDFLLESYKYILKTYDIDSFQLDYIRYTTRSSRVDMGYSETAINEFKAKYGAEPTFNTSASTWSNWVKFRCDYISNFVLEIKLMMQEVAPDVLLSADVVPDSSEAKNYNYQDFTSWVKNGWIDILYPMAYNSAYQSTVKSLVSTASGKSLVVAGLGIYLDEHDAMDMQSQSLNNNIVGTFGSAFFESSSFLKKGTGAILTKGVFRENAVTPTYDVSTSAQKQLDNMTKRINDIIVPLSGFSSSKAKTLTDAIKKLSSSCTDTTYSSQNLSNLKSAINSSSLDAKAKSRLLSDLNAIVNVYTITNKKISSEGSATTPPVDNNNSNSDTSKDEPSNDTSKDEPSNNDTSKDEPTNNDTSKDEPSNNDTPKDEPANNDTSKDESKDEPKDESNDESKNESSTDASEDVSSDTSTDVSDDASSDVSSDASNDVSDGSTDVSENFDNTFESEDESSVASSEAPESSEAPANTDNVNKNDLNGALIWIILGVAIVLGGAGVAVFFLKKKKK